MACRFFLLVFQADREKDDHRIDSPILCIFLALLFFIRKSLVYRYKNLFELNLSVRFPALLAPDVRVERYLHGALPTVVLFLSQNYYLASKEVGLVCLHGYL